MQSKPKCFTNSPTDSHSLVHGHLAQIEIPWQFLKDLFIWCLKTCLHNACTNVCTQLLDMFTPYLKDIRKNIQAEKVWIVKTFELIDSKINLFILIFLGVLWLDVSFLLLIQNCWYVQTTSPLLLSSILLLILFTIFLTTVDD